MQRSMGAMQRSIGAEHWSRGAAEERSIGASEGSTRAAEHQREAAEHSSSSAAEKRIAQRSIGAKGYCERSRASTLPPQPCAEIYFIIFLPSYLIFAPSQLYIAHARKVCIDSAHHFSMREHRRNARAQRPRACEQGRKGRKHQQRKGAKAASGLYHDSCEHIYPQAQ